MVAVLRSTNEGLKIARYNLARACDDLEAARVASQVRPWRKALRGILPALVLALLQACAGGLGELELEHDAGEHDAAAELEHDAGGDAAQETHGDAAQQSETDGDVDWLTLVHPHCAGAWADRDDSSTRFVAHPDTALCTFSCRWLEPKCDEPWYGDPRCFPAHELRLEQVCGDLGGSCELASDGESYCEAQP